MMSGLRSQREYTITCVSLKSGIASSGTCCIDHHPASTAPATKTNTMNRFVPESSMRRLIIKNSYQLSAVSYQPPYLQQPETHGALAPRPSATRQRTAPRLLMAEG